MARPRMKDDEKKGYLLSIRVTPEEFRSFGREARKLSMTKSEWSRMWLRRGAGLVKFVAVSRSQGYD